MKGRSENPMHFLLVLQDLSHPQTILRLGARLAQLADAAITLLAVSRGAQTTDLAEKSLQHAREWLRPEPRAIEARVRVGQPTREILREVRSGDYDLLLISDEMAKSSHSPRSERSTVIQIAERAPVSVWVIRGDDVPMRRILLCDSGSPSSSLVERFAHLARLFSGVEQVTVLHVMSQISAWPKVPDEQLKASAEELIAAHSPEGQMLERDLALLRDVGFVARPQVRHGLVIDEILAEVRSGGHDLLVIGPCGASRWQRVLLEDQCQPIVAHADCSVLVLR